MRVVNNYGYLKFYPKTVGQINAFMRFFGVELFAKGNYFTFESLLSLPRYSVLGAPYGNLNALVNFEGRSAEEVLQANEFVYHITSDALVDINSVIGNAEPWPATFYFTYDAPLIQAGFKNSQGKRISGYSGEILDPNYVLRMDEVFYHE